MNMVEMENIQTKSDLYLWMKKAIEDEAFFHYGLNPDHPLVIESIDYFYSSDAYSQSFRFDDLLSCGVAYGSNAKILDLASGFGQFVLAALESGLDCWGLEPADSRLKFIKKKVELFNLPHSYLERFREGVGEDIPYPADTFDFITSFQTMEHVQDLGDVALNMIRVVKSGGGIHIRCPNYFGTFEGHYRLPWLPLPISKKPMKIILRIMGRPTSGLSEQINYITQRSLIKKFTKAANQMDVRILIIDCEDLVLEAGLRRRGIPVSFITMGLVKLIIFLRDIFRREMSINLLIRVIKK